MFEYQFQPIQYVKFEQFSKKSLILFAIAMHDAITDFILLHPLSCMMQYFWQYLLKVVHHILKIVSSSLIVLHDFYSKNLCEWLTDWQQGWDGGYNKLTNGFIFFPFQARSQRRNIEYLKTQLRLTNWNVTNYIDTLLG